MFLRFDEKLSIKKCKHGKRARPHSELTRTKKICVCVCDQCFKEFEICHHPRKTSLSEFHFCSLECKNTAQKKHNVLCVKYEKMCLEKFGVLRGFIQPNALQQSLEKSHSVEAELRRSVSLKKFYNSRPDGWKNPGNLPAACKKRHETMKKNGTYGKSKCEDLLFELLKNWFGEENVERQVSVNGWAIDFWIKQHDVFIQVDGVYWHGIGKTEDELRAVTSSRGKSILATRLRDSSQNKWFCDEQKQFIRVTDQFVRAIYENNNSNSTFS